MIYLNNVTTNLGAASARDISADPASKRALSLNSASSPSSVVIFFMATVIATPLGAAIPQHLPHAISVSLPTWQDNVDYEEGRPRVIDAMVNGYPRFFINKSIQKVHFIRPLQVIVY